MASCHHAFTDIDEGDVGFSTLIQVQGYQGNIAVLQDSAFAARLTRCR